MATVLVTEGTPPFRSVELYGRAEVTPLRDSNELVRRLAVRYYGKEVGEARAKTFEGFEMERVRLEPGRLRTWDFVDAFGAAGEALDL